MYVWHISTSFPSVAALDCDGRSVAAACVVNGNFPCSSLASVAKTKGGLTGRARRGGSVVGGLQKGCLR